MAEASGLAQHWFFLRYADPDPHLRVRWKGDPETLTRHLLPEITRFSAPLTEDGLISRVAVDTYDRELERYGGVEGTGISEEIFWADSRAVMRLLACEPPADLTELIAVTVDDLLAALGLTVGDRLRWYCQQADVSGDPAVRRRAGEDYRTRQKRLRTLLGTPAMPALLGDEVADVLAQRKAIVAPAAERLAKLEATARLAAPHRELWSSYVHIHCNRLLGGRAPSEGHLLQLLQRTRRSLDVAPLR
jgi:thiopeptide-type bacteriocin biosynthesis protein